MSLPTFLACSWEMPSLSSTEILDSRPDCRGSPASRTFRDWLRLISLSLKTSSTADARSSAFAEISTACSPERLMVAPVFLKSNRWLISRCAWLIALSISCWSSLLTMSNDESAMARVPPAAGSADFKSVIGLRYSFVPAAPETIWGHHGRLPERPMGADCKSVGFAFEGSNPSPATGRTSCQAPDPHLVWGFAAFHRRKSRRNRPVAADPFGRPRCPQV